MTKEKFASAQKTKID